MSVAELLACPIWSTCANSPSTVFRLPTAAFRLSAIPSEAFITAANPFGTDPPAIAIRCSTSTTDSPGCATRASAPASPSAVST